MWRKVKLVWRFYRSAMLPACLCISLGLVVPVLSFGPAIVPWLCLAKLLLSAVIVYFVVTLRPADFYYYANLGLPRRTLLVWSCVADYLLFYLLIRLATLLAPYTLSVLQNAAP